MKLYFSRKLKKYIEEEIFPQYEVNDKAHGIVHIIEVIRRAFALNDTFNLDLDEKKLNTSAVNIICILNESLYDLNIIEDLELNKDNMEKLTNSFNDFIGYDIE